MISLSARRRSQHEHDVRARWRGGTRSLHSQNGELVIMAAAAAEIPHAVILSGPLFYQPHITALYGGYKRTLGDWVVPKCSSWVAG